MASWCDENLIKSPVLNHNEGLLCQLELFDVLTSSFLVRRGKFRNFNSKDKIDEDNYQYSITVLWVLRHEKCSHIKDVTMID